jgi:hypothetical protein
MKVWTQAYRPFMLGGDVHRPVCCELEPLGPTLDLGKNYFGVSVIAPTGKVFIVEVITGAIIGSSLAEVRKDVEDGDEAIMRKQIVWATQMANKAEMVEPERFWTYVKGATVG